MFKGIIIVVILSGLLLMSNQDVSSVDELYLTGVVKSYDKEKGLIWIDVKSEGCKGLREFKVPENAISDLDPSLIGQKIEFFINSSRCERGHLYNMILGRQR